MEQRQMLILKNLCSMSGDYDNQGCGSRSSGNHGLEEFLMKSKSTRVKRYREDGVAY
ncbi:hypothetical protein Scep_017210 [Stephania cephalantha]|uniref:Uncharacterized protein n=1 Tax=Stephania cephalantha TaxID=152367 RepID=A0AAP0IQZ8_9MAGN